MTYYRVNFGTDGKYYCKSNSIESVIKYAKSIHRDSKVTKINFVPRQAYIIGELEN